MLIARTDARAKMGLEEAVRRANAALAAGADIAFVDAGDAVGVVVIIAVAAAVAAVVAAVSSLLLFLLYFLF